ncbi:hypothetical protein RHIZ_17475 [Rhizobium skierniewicense]|uniref:hypothetical protein n=1 Tax=Rhizobium skierniewicense TaxID=984260 RepID=UPI001FADA62A|nr:hypothetical protein [Rhizobium skierniewicense]MCI9867750.1 hypothetical protein [Rhizobium skierniewicense]
MDTLSLKRYIPQGLAIGSSPTDLERWPEHPVFSPIIPHHCGEIADTFLSSSYGVKEEAIIVQKGDFTSLAYFRAAAQQIGADPNN